MKLQFTLEIDIDFGTMAYEDILRDFKPNPTELLNRAEKIELTSVYNSEDHETVTDDFMKAAFTWDKDNYETC